MHTRAHTKCLYQNYYTYEADLENIQLIYWIRLGISHPASYNPENMPIKGELITDRVWVENDSDITHAFVWTLDQVIWAFIYSWISFIDDFAVCTPADPVYGPADRLNTRKSSRVQRLFAKITISILSLGCVESNQSSRSRRVRGDGNDHTPKDICM